jgi:hypothetical protein
MEFSYHGGFFKIAAFADDLTVGIAAHELPLLISLVDDYCKASNGRINVDKSSLVPLIQSVTPPNWTVSSPFRIQDASIPFRVLGYNLVRAPGGIEEDWDDLTRKLHRTADHIRRRHCSVRGRILLVQSLMLSKIWYKGQLSSPSGAQIAAWKALVWDTI